MNSIAYKENSVEELLDGEIFLMLPSPAINHIFIAGNIYNIFYNFLREKSCIPFPDGTELVLSTKDRVIPDMMVVCDRNIVKDNYVEGTPDLIVEVLSKSTAKNDRGYKKKLYEKHGIKEYWIVDCKNTSVEVFILKDGSYELDNIYYNKGDTEEENEKFEKEFKCSLFDDLIIKMDEIFYRVIN